MSAVIGGEQFTTLVAAARAGAEWAWTAIYRDLSPRVLGYLRAQKASDPEDVTGEVFLQVVRDLHRFEGDARAFRSWVLTITHHRLVDARRRAARRPVDAAPAEVLETWAETGDTEEDALSAIQTQSAAQLLDRLTSEQRSVLLLRVMGGLTVDEVAAAIGKRPGAVKALQRRGLATLRRAIRKEGVTL